MQDTVGGDIAQDVVISAARSGDPSAWAQIDRYFRPILVRYAARKGVSEPEDLAQEVMYAAFRQLDDLDEDWNRFRAWLFTVAYRRCADHHRRRYRRPETLTDTMPESVDPTGGADEPLWAEGAAAEVTAALSILADRERDVVSMRVMDEMSTETVAQRLGVTHVNVRVTQSRALGKLRSYLENNGGVLDKRFRGLVPLAFGESVLRWLRKMLRPLAGSGAAGAATATSPGLVVGGGAVAASLLAIGTAVTLSLPTPVAGQDHVSEAPEPVSLVQESEPRPADLDRPATSETDESDDPGTASGEAEQPGEQVTTTVVPTDSTQPATEEPDTSPPTASGDAPVTSSVAATPPPTSTPPSSSSGGGDLIDETVDATGGTLDTVGNLAGSLTGTVVDALDQTGTAVGDALNTVTGALTSGDLTETVNGTGQAVTDLVEDVTGTVGDTLSNTTEALDETTNDLLDTVNELLGSLGGSLFGP